jgi:tRNA (guanine37-N1)-methyltransferase
MRIDILTLFPEMFKGPFDESIIQRAQKKGLVEIKIHNLRKWAVDKRGTVDDRPYGGGTGMILMIEPIYKALGKLKNSKPKTKVILLDPRGKVFNQKIARKLSKEKHLIFICGHYEGVDERVKEHLADEVISIGDYILTGGELPAMVITDAVVRLLPGVLEKPEATKFESFSNLKIGKLKIGSLLEYPQYTRPENFLGWKVPKILLSGNHQKIAEWRKKKAQELTKKLRPDLI